MRNRIEQLIIDEEKARQKRAKINRNDEPRTWALADADWTGLRGEISSSGREAIRALGLARDINRALGGSGLAVRSIGMELDPIAVVVELEGGAETPAQWAKAEDPAVSDAIRRVADEFHSRTSIEVRFPYSRLSGN